MKIKHTDQGVVVHTYNPSTQETGRRIKFKSSLVYTRGPYLKKQRGP
jgi:hypothetical protein